MSCPADLGLNGLGAQVVGAEHAKAASVGDGRGQLWTSHHPHPDRPDRVLDPEPTAQARPQGAHPAIVPLRGPPATAIVPLRWPSVLLTPASVHPTSNIAIDGWSTGRPSRLLARDLPRAMPHTAPFAAVRHSH